MAAPAGTGPVATDGRTGATPVPASPAPGGLAARERRVIAWGAAIAVAALLLSWVAVPYARRWQAREDRIAAERVRLAATRALLADTAAMAARAAAVEAALASAPQRVVRARSLALAAAEVQSLLREIADASGLLTTRLDVSRADSTAVGTAIVAGSPVAASPDADAPPGAPTGPASPDAIPATLQATGDIHGLAQLLERLERAPRVVLVERLTVQRNPALAGAPDVLQLTLSLRAPVVVVGSESLR